VRLVTKAHINECIDIVLQIFALGNIEVADIHQKQKARMQHIK